MRIKTKNEPKLNIYFILDREHKIPALKIGSTSKSVDARVSSLQTGNPSPLKLLGYVFGFESYYHEKFKKHLIRGEWFEWEPIKYEISEMDFCYPELELNFYRRLLTRSAYNSHYKKGLMERHIMLEIVRLYKDDKFLKKVIFDLMSGKYERGPPAEYKIKWC